jgi:hypothetical protein
MQDCDVHNGQSKDWPGMHGFCLWKLGFQATYLPTAVSTGSLPSSNGFTGTLEDIARYRCNIRCLEFSDTGSCASEKTGS